jgi:hypothetical protein
MRRGMAGRRYASAVSGLILGLALGLLAAPAGAIPLLSFVVTTPGGAGNPVALTPGDPLSVDVVVSGLSASGDPSVAAFDITVAFDPAQLGFVGGSVAVNSGVGTPLGGFFPGDQIITTGAGTVKVQFVSNEPTSFFDAQPAAFTLFGLDFVATAGLSATSLALSPASLFLPDGDPIAKTVSGLGVQLPEPGAAGLLAGALLVAAAIRAGARRAR